jgi:hypothetical protein
VRGDASVRGVRWFAHAVAVVVAGLASLAQAGCGRIDFHSAPPAADAAIDAAPDGPTGPEPCAATYTTMIGQSYYRFTATGASWDVAEHACEADGRGSHLVVFDNTLEMNMVEALVSGALIWIGVTDRVADTQFLDVLGDKPSFLPSWEAGDPSLPGPGCIRFNPSSRLIRDQVCGAQVAYVCECDGIVARPSSY